jgi:hypothetical protein
MSAKRQPLFRDLAECVTRGMLLFEAIGRGYAKVLIESVAPTEAGGKREQHANRQILQVTNATLKALRKLDNAIHTALPSPTKGRYAISRAAHRPGGLNTSAHSPETSASPSLYPLPVNPPSPTGEPALTSINHK